MTESCKPRIIVHVEGGVVQGIAASVDIDYAILDEDGVPLDDEDAKYREALSEEYDSLPYQG